MKLTKRRLSKSVFCAILACVMLCLTACETKAFRANYVACQWGMLDRVVKILPEQVFKNSGKYRIYGNFSTSSNHGNEAYALQQDVTMDFSRLKISGDVLLQERYLELITEKDYKLSTDKNYLVTKTFKDGQKESFTFDDSCGVMDFMPEYFEIMIRNLKAAVNSRSFPITDVSQDFRNSCRYLKITITPSVATALFFETGQISFASGEIFLVQDNVSGCILNMLLRFDAQGVAPDVVTSSNGLEKISTELFILKK